MAFLSSFLSENAWLELMYLSLPSKLQHTRQNFEEIKRAGLFLFCIYLAIERRHHARASPGNLSVAWPRADVIFLRGWAVWQGTSCWGSVDIWYGLCFRRCTEQWLQFLCCLELPKQCGGELLPLGWTVDGKNSSSPVLAKSSKTRIWAGRNTGSSVCN